MRSNYLARVALLAALYMPTGKLGLLLAVGRGSTFWIELPLAAQAAAAGTAA